VNARGTRKMIKNIVIILILLMSFVSAETIKVDKQTIEYDQVIKYEKMNSYYLKDKLILSTFDDNNDGKIDQWFLYGDNFVVQSALGDMDNNGKPDYFVGYDAQGNVVSERVTVSFSKRIIDFIFKFKYYVLGFIVLILLIFFIRKIKKKTRKIKGVKHGKKRN
jgi:hypothetical protein